MITSHTLKTTLVGTLLFGGIALAGLSITAGTAQAFDPQPDPPASRSPQAPFRASIRSPIRPESSASPVPRLRHQTGRSASG